MAPAHGSWARAQRRARFVVRRPPSWPGCSAALRRLHSRSMATAPRPTPFRCASPMAPSTRPSPMALPEEVARLLPLLDEANERLLATVGGWSEADVRQPSGLPGWSRAHVLAHLINNADGNRAAAWGATRDLALEVYPGGRSQRDAE